MFLTCIIYAYRFWQVVEEKCNCLNVLGSVVSVMAATSFAISFGFTVRTAQINRTPSVYLLKVLYKKSLGLQTFVFSKSKGTDVPRLEYCGNSPPPLLPSVFHPPSVSRLMNVLSKKSKFARAWRNCECTADTHMYRPLLPSDKQCDATCREKQIKKTVAPLLPAVKVTRHLQLHAARWLSLRSAANSRHC
jgi:hypothetical protein